ncbi:MAG: hypothetical protein ACF8Q5_08305 [Phycisphaerales bacterium JB040]
MAEADTDRTKDRIAELINMSDTVLATHKPNPPNVIGFSTLSSGEFAKWREKALTLLQRVAGSDHPYTTGFRHRVTTPYRSQVRSGKGILESFLEDYIEGDFNHSQRLEGQEDSALEKIIQIADRFHDVARQLRYRHDQRATLNISDEYDVQDLMHSILRLYFDDIRTEEYSPSYAGKNSRIDFLIKREKIVLEIKHTRQSMSTSDLGTQLIDDIARYKSHPDCSILACFVYDPEGRLPNPRGLENDLSEGESDPAVLVLIRP